MPACPPRPRREPPLARARRGSFAGPARPPVPRPVSTSLQEYARGVGGGLLFSLPLFYTMETWAIGMTASPARLAAIVAGTFGLLVGYNQFAGITSAHGLRDALLESVEEMGLGLCVAAGLLALLGRFPDALTADALGVLTLEGMVAAVGVSVGTAQLGQTPEGESGGASGGDGPPEPRSLGGEIAVALCGAVLIACNVAPTEEVVLLGAEMGAGRLAGLAALSLAVGGGLLYVSAFRGARRFAGSAMGPVGGTVMTYAVALAASLALLAAFGRLDLTSAMGVLGPLVVLAFPAMLGASAGRLLLGQS